MSGSELSAYDLTGLVAGLAGGSLFLGGALVAIVAALRVLAVRRRPGKGRVARGALAAAGVSCAAGVALFWASEVSPFRGALDRHAGALSAVAVAAAALAGWRAARRRSAPCLDSAPADAVATLGTNGGSATVPKSRSPRA